MNPEIGWPGHLPDPQHVEVRASIMLRLAQQGLNDMSDPNLDFYRIMLGFFGVVVFGRSVTLALQHLKTFDRKTFHDWYAPWLAEMKDDPLCKFFSDLRSAILHDIEPLIGVVVASASVTGATGPLSFTFDPTKGQGFAGYPDATRRGSVSLGKTHPLPTKHRGQLITDTDLRHLADLYLQYLAVMLQSALPVIAFVQTRFRAEHPYQPPEGS